MVIGSPLIFFCRKDFVVIFLRPSERVFEEMGEIDDTVPSFFEVVGAEDLVGGCNFFDQIK